MKTLNYKVSTRDIIEVKRRRYARLIVTRALKSGNLKKPECCDLCEAERADIEAHHVDYGAPMRIHWLCRKCHGLAHRVGHPLNPMAFAQTPIPAAMEENEKIVVATLIPINTFLALKKASEEQKKPIAEIIRDNIIQTYPVASLQLDLFEDTNDRAQNEQIKGIHSLEKDEKLLSKSKISFLPQARSKRRSNMPRMEQQLFPIFERHGAHASSMQWTNAN